MSFFLSYCWVTNILFLVTGKDVIVIYKMYALHGGFKWPTPDNWNKMNWVVQSHTSEKLEFFVFDTCCSTKHLVFRLCILSFYNEHSWLLWLGEQPRSSPFDSQKSGLSERLLEASQGDPFTLDLRSKESVFGVFACQDFNTFFH